MRSLQVEIKMLDKAFVKIKDRTLFPTKTREASSLGLIGGGENTGFTAVKLPHEKRMLGTMCHEKNRNEPGSGRKNE